ncbi:MAG: dTDP-4-dehydrorhamnose reductase [Balneolaceae bacterium]|nr:dTDP-4-dehydrorhamnose reductase [Balneolaceae bacterium]
MHYLITGAGGQLGKEWVLYAGENGLSFSAYTSSRLDITDKSRVVEVLESESPDVVINCAAYTKVDKAESDREKAFSVNEEGVKNLAVFCKNAGIKMVHYSTDYVFPGELADRSKFPDGYPEDAVCKPVNVYGASKRAGEVALEESGCDYLLIRVSWLCGRHGGNFVKTMLRLAKERDEISVVDDQFGSPAFTFDVARKTDALLKQNANGMYHISSSGLISWADYAEQIFLDSGLSTSVKRITTAEFPTEAKRPAYSLLSNKKMESAGIKPLDWKDGLDRLLMQLKEDEN